MMKEEFEKIVGETVSNEDKYDETIPVSCMNFYRKITYENAEEFMHKICKIN